MSDSKVTILENIRIGLKNTSAKPPSKEAPPIHLSKFVLEDTIDVVFASNFTQAGGYFIYCEDFDAFYKHLKSIIQKQEWHNVNCWNPQLLEFFQNQDYRPIRIGHLLDKAHAGLTTCDFLIAENGSIMISAGLPCGRMLPIYPPNWLIIATMGQLLENKEMAWAQIKDKYPERPPTMVSMIGNAAHTRLFEGKTMKGGIGPQNIFLFLIDDEILEVPKVVSRLDQLKKEKTDDDLNKTNDE